MKPENPANVAAFQSALISAYSVLLKTPPYAAAAINNTPETLAAKVLAALLRGDGDNTGAGVRQACKVCGIASTYKAIEGFLFLPDNAPGVTTITPVKTRKVSTVILSGIHSLMTGVFRINYAHGLVTLEYTDGKREAAKISPDKWAEISEKPFDIVSHVQSCRVPANA